MTFQDYKKQAIQDLSHYNYLKSSLITLPQRIEFLKNNFSHYSYSTQTKVMQSTQADSKMISHLEQIEKLEHTLKYNTIKLSSIETALSTLTEDDYKLMFSFYINRQRNSVSTLARNTFTDRSCIYRRAQKALKKYIFAFFGTIE